MVNPINGDSLPGRQTYRRLLGVDGREIDVHIVVKLLEKRGAMFGPKYKWDPP